MGADFRGGSNRHADATRTKAIATELGMQAKITDLLQHQAQQISSTAARAALADGAIEQVTGLLGRYHANRGTFVRVINAVGPLVGPPQI